MLVALEAAGLNVETEYSSHPKIPEGAIIAHKPAGGVILKTGDLVSLEISGQAADENIGRLLPFEYYVSEDENKNLSRHIKIIIRDDSGERIEVDQHYSPDTVINLEQKGVRVFGQTQVIVFENDEKVLERLYK